MEERTTLTDGRQVYPEHRNKIAEGPRKGQQQDYVVLAEEERAKGFVRPVRRSYKHLTCGTEGGALDAAAIRKLSPQPTDEAREELDKQVHFIRSDVFEVLRRHDVSEQCFAEVAMVTQAYLRSAK